MKLIPVTGSEPDLHEVMARGLAVRAGPGVDVSDWVDHLESARKTNRLQGLRTSPGEGPLAIVLWDPTVYLGAQVHLIYAEGSLASGPSYRELLEAVRNAAGNVAFVPGPLAGIRPDEEEGLLRDLGFARYGRSEMRLRDDAPLPPPSEPERAARSIRPEDEPSIARLHRRAYHDQFDRYLMMEDPDEERDALREVHDAFGGRWGTFDPEASVVLEDSGEPVAAVLVVHRADRALIVDVAVDPAQQGRGRGRAALTASLRALRARKVANILLNVTEGNDRAQRLYASLGFVRSLGPSRDWYQTAVVPVRP